jgi:antitoxin PrlF
MDTSSAASNSPISVDTRITSQGQVSVPAAIRRKLGVAPGSTLQWTLRGDEVVVKRRNTVSSLDMHKALFPDGPPKPISLKQMKDAIAQHARDRYARR